MQPQLNSAGCGGPVAVMVMLTTATLPSRPFVCQWPVRLSKESSGCGGWPRRGPMLLAAGTEERPAQRQAEDLVAAVEAAAGVRARERPARRDLGPVDRQRDVIRCLRARREREGGDERDDELSHLRSSRTAYPFPETWNLTPGLRVLSGMRVLAAALIVTAVASGGLQPARDLRAPRAVHTATVLPDGRVLVAGGCVDPGCESPTATTELYDPVKRRSVVGPRLSRPLVGHAAIALRDGSVLVLGGWSGRVPTASAERLVGGRFVATGSMLSPRGGFTATRLRDGRVLVVGGSSGSEALASAELYDPESGSFVATGSLARSREAHSATLLRDGRVLVVGGSDGADVLRTAEIYDPTTGRFSPTGPLSAPRHKHAAVVLRDGRVLVVGGSDARDFRGRYRSTEVWSADDASIPPRAGAAGAAFQDPRCCCAPGLRRRARRGRRRDSGAPASGRSLRRGRRARGRAHVRDRDRAAGWERSRRRRLRRIDHANCRHLALSLGLSVRLSAPTAAGWPNGLAAPVLPGSFHDRNRSPAPSQRRARARAGGLRWALRAASRRLRFLGSKPRLLEPDLGLLVDVGRAGREAVIAIDPETG